jgi:Coenzyme PQQ synthesis protein D (PqqD)
MTSADPTPDADTPVRRSDVEWVELEGEGVLYDPRAHTVHRLNSAAAVVWKACDGTASQAEITRAIGHAHSGPRGTIERDVAAVIAPFCRLRLVRQSPPRTATFAEALRRDERRTGQHIRAAGRCELPHLRAGEREFPLRRRGSGARSSGAPAPAPTRLEAPPECG